jgi:NosR/NirI family transcriptional regulator, nitrous oxide reductase regulator
MLNPISCRFFIAALLLITSAATLAQPPRQPVEGNPVRTPFSTDVQAHWLTQVMPAADTFSDKQGQPPAYRAYRSNTDTGSQELVGYVFLSSDTPPEERGYSAPIPMLIGVNTDFEITGIKLLNYVESYVNTLGDFLADPVFQAQFQGKSIRDEYRLNRDIDGISGATVSTFAISRGARDAARRVAQAYLNFEPGDPVLLARSARVLETLQQSSWDELMADNVIQQLSMPTLTGGTLELTVTYMGNDAMGEFFIGRNAYMRAERDASARLGSSQMLLLAVGGDSFELFRQDRVYIRQGDIPRRRITANRLVTAGNADEGLIAGRAEFAGALVLDENIDTSLPIIISYQPLGSRDFFEIQYMLTGIGRAVADNEQILSDREVERIIRVQNSAIRKFINDPPWGVTPWAKVAWLTLVFALAMAAFFTKRASVRWAALSLTMVYLGFIDGGFLSVSHITGALLQGPGIFLNNLPVLMIVVFTLVTTLIWGRIFCSALCPFGAVQDFITQFTPRRLRQRIGHIKIPKVLHERSLWIKYAVLAFILGAALFANNVMIFQYFEPFGTFFFMSGSAMLFAILAAILLACVAVPRFYCRYVCPLGAALGVVSLVSPLRIKRVPQCGVCTVCEHACPTGAIQREKINFKECVRCDICESKLIVKAGSCKHDMSKIIVRHKELRTD